MPSCGPTAASPGTQGAVGHRRSTGTQAPRTERRGLDEVRTAALVSINISDKGMCPGECGWPGSNWTILPLHPRLS